MSLSLIVNKYYHNTSTRKHTVKQVRIYIRYSFDINTFHLSSGIRIYHKSIWRLFCIYLVAAILLFYLCCRSMSFSLYTVSFVCPLVYIILATNVTRCYCLVRVGVGLLFCLFSIYNAVIDLFTCRKKKREESPLRFLFTWTGYPHLVRRKW